MITLIIVGKLLLAMILGALIGVERGHTGKPAGMRTYALISLGAALFAVIARDAFFFFSDVAIGYDPSRMLGHIIVGIGFVAAGVIMRREKRVEGLTTAAGVWLAAAVGMTVGVELYIVAFVATILVLFIFWPMGHLERFIEDRFGFEMTRTYKSLHNRRRFSKKKRKRKRS